MGYFYTILVALFIFIIWNTYSFKTLIRKRQDDNEPLSDKRYYELKNKQDFVIALGSLILFIAGFIGIRSVNEVKADIGNSVKQSIDSINFELKNAKDSLNSVSKGLSTYKYDFLLLEQSTGVAKSKVKNTLNDISLLENSVNEIRNKNIIRQDIYIVNNVIYPSKYEGPLVYYFRNFKTIDNTSLPIFKSPPYILAFTNDGGRVDVINVWKDSVKIDISETYGRPPEEYRVILLIASSLAETFK